MLFDRSIYNKIVQFSLSETSTIIAPAAELALGSLQDDGTLKILDTSRIPLTSFQFVNGRIRNTENILIDNDTLSDKYITHVVFISSNNEFLNALYLRRRLVLEKGARLLIEKNSLKVDLNRRSENFTNINLSALEASAVSVATLSGQAITETTTGSRFFAYLSAVVDANAFGVNGFGQLNGILTDDLVAIPRVNGGTVSGSASLTGDAFSISVGDAIGTATLTGFADGFVDVIAAASSAGPLVADAVGDVTTFGNAVGNAALSTTAEALTDVPAAASSAGPLTGTADGTTVVSASSIVFSELTANTPEASVTAFGIAAGNFNLTGDADGLSATFASASGSANLTSTANGGTDVNAAASSAGPLVGDAQGEVTAFGVAAGTATLTALSNAQGADVPAAASSAGPLTGDADGVVARLFAFGDATASLTGDSTGFIDVPAAASSAGPLTASAEGAVTAFAEASTTSALTSSVDGLAIVSATSSGSSSLTGSVEAFVDVNAAASSAGPLVGSADGILSRQPGVADATASLTGSGLGGVAGTGIADDATASLTGSADGLTVAFAIADSTADLSSTSSAAVTAFGEASASFTLTSNADALSLVPAAASSAGPLVASADGVISRQPGVADATASLTGDAASLVDVNAAASSAGPLVGDAQGDVTAFAEASTTSDLTGDSSGLTLVSGVASSTSDLTGNATSLVDVNAAASSAGPLVGSADGILSRQPGVADATASLTGDAASVVASVAATASASAGLTSSASAGVLVGAASSSSGPLTGDAEGNISLLRMDADSSASLAGDSDAIARVFADASATADVTGDADGQTNVSASADSTADLTVSAAGGSVPINTVLPVITDTNGGNPIIGDTVSVSTGTWESDPALTSPDYSYQWRRESTTLNAVDWIGAPSNINTSHTIQLDGGIVKTGAAGFNNSTYVADNQDLTGDGEFQFSPQRNPMGDVFVGLTDDPGSSNTTRFLTYDFAIRFRSNSTIFISELGVYSTPDAGNQTYSPSDTFSIERTGTTIEYFKNGSLIHTSTTTSSATLTPAINIFGGDDGISEADVTDTQFNDIVGETNSTYILDSADINVNVDCVVTANNGFGGDQVATADAIGPVIGVFDGEASATADLTGDSQATTIVSGTSSVSTSLTTDADGDLSRIPATASATSELTTSADSLSLVPAAASSAGPLVASADGFLSRQPGVADATASLTGDAASLVDVNAAASSAGPLTASAEGFVTASASADTAADLTGDANGNVTLIRANADSTADLTGDSKVSWADALGVLWDYAWDFTDSPASGGDIPALPGGVDLDYDAVGSTASYILATAPDAIDPLAYGLAQSQVSRQATYTSTSRVYHEVQLPLGDRDLHIRAIMRVQPAIGNGKAAFAIDLDTDTGRQISATVQVSGTINFGAGTLAGATGFSSVPLALGDWFLMDLVIRGDDLPRLYVNGSLISRAFGPSTPARAFAPAALPTLRVGGAVGWNGFQGDVAFFGIRHGDITLSEHRDALDAVLPVLADDTSELTGDADGFISRQPGVADATASLTTDADGDLSRIPASADSTINLTSSASAGVLVGAASSSSGPLTGSADGNVTLLRGEADSSASLTGNADNAWDDAVGLSWEYAFDGSAVATGDTTIPDIGPRYDGSLGLQNPVAVQYNAGALPSNFDLAALGLSGGTWAGDGINYSEGSAPGIANESTLHIRYIWQQDAFHLESLGRFGERLGIHVAVVTTTSGIVQVSVRNNNSILVNISLNHPSNEPHVLDILVQNESGSNTRLDAWLNREYGTATTASHSFAGVTAGDIPEMNRGTTHPTRIGFLGFRFGTVTQADHDAADEALFDYSASSSGTLTTSADGFLSRQPGVADATADLTGDSDGNISRLPGVADATASLTADAIPAGIVFHHSWDLGDGAGGTADFSPTEGTVDLQASSSGYFVGTSPYNLASGSVAYAPVRLDIDTAALSLTSDDGFFIRGYVFTPEDGLWSATIGVTSGARVLLQKSVGSSSMLSRVYRDDGTLIINQTLSVPTDKWWLMEVWVREEGGNLTATFFYDGTENEYTATGSSWSNSNLSGAVIDGTIRLGAGCGELSVGTITGTHSLANHNDLVTELNNATDYSDTTGLGWNHAWDFTASTGGTADVPALTGGTDLGVSSGTYSKGTFASTYVSTGLGLDGTSPAVCAGTDFSASGLTISDAAHLRVIARWGGASNSTHYVGGTTGQRVQLLWQPVTGRVRAEAYNDAGVNFASAEIDLPDFDDDVVVDAYFYPDGSDLRVDLYANGQSATVSTTLPGTWTTLSGEYSADNVQTDALTLVAIRDGGFDQIQHDPAVNAVLTSVLVDGRDYDYAWLGDDASSGSAWVDAKSSYSVPWSSTAPATVTSVPNPGLSEASFGSLAAVDLTGGSSNSDYTWASSGDASLSLAAGTSAWYRVITRIEATQDTLPHTRLFQMRDTNPTPTLRIDRITTYNGAVGSGGGAFTHFDDGVNVNTINTVGSGDSRGEWVIMDVYYNGSNGNVQVVCDGFEVTGSYAGTAPVSIWNEPAFEFAIDSNTEVALIAATFGSAADDWSIEMHNHDQTLLRAGT